MEYYESSKRFHATSFFLYPPKNIKTEVSSCSEGVYMERSVACNGLICFYNILEALQIGLRKKFKAFLKSISMV